MTATFLPATSAPSQSASSSHGEPSLPHLLEMEQAAQELWSVEPSCDIAQRTLLLTRLSRVTRRVDHLIFRQQFHPDEPIDSTEVQRCAHQLRELAARWTHRQRGPALAA